MISSVRPDRFERTTFGFEGPQKTPKRRRKRAVGPWIVTPVCQFPLLPTFTAVDKRPRRTAWDRVKTDEDLDDD
jgi:hypothetical protein